MNTIRAKLASVGLLLLSAFTFANDEQVSIDSWSIGLNIGVGQQSSFITGQDDVELYLLPNIQYYGEQLFFDNGTLGYTFHDEENFAFSLISELNPYGLYFEQSAFGESFNPLYLFSQRVEGEEAFSESNIITDTDLITPPSGEDPESPGIGASTTTQSYNLPTPDLSLDAGFQINWFMSANQDLSVKLLHDINSKHSGKRTKFTWSYKSKVKTLGLKLNLGFDWLDKNASNYYFGVDPDIETLTFARYRLNSTINPFITLTANMPVTENISLVAHLKYLKLDSDIDSSPITNKGYSTTQFVGIHYRFW